jgi:hypothetical protein
MPEKDPRDASATGNGGSAPDEHVPGSEAHLAGNGASGTAKKMYCN